MRYQLKCLDLIMDMMQFIMIVIPTIKREMFKFYGRPDFRQILKNMGEISKAFIHPLF